VVNAVKERLVEAWVPTPERLEVVHVVRSHPRSSELRLAKHAEACLCKPDLWIQLELVPRTTRQSSQTPALDRRSARRPGRWAEAFATCRHGVALDGLVLVGDCMNVEVAVDPDALDPLLFFGTTVPRVVVARYGAFYGSAHRRGFAEHGREEQDVGICSETR